LILRIVEFYDLCHVSAGVVPIDGRWMRKHSGAPDEFERVNVRLGVGTLTLSSEMTVLPVKVGQMPPTKKNQISQQRDARFPSSKALDAVQSFIDFVPPTNWKRSGNVA
jgi:hypothetical protein